MIKVVVCTQTLIKLISFKIKHVEVIVVYSVIVARVIRLCLLPLLLLLRVRSFSVSLLPSAFMSPKVLRRGFQQLPPLAVVERRLLLFLTREGGSIRTSRNPDADATSLDWTSIR